ncbi:MAG TPA: SUMF1/EgtB/PvdO family nonheme iron enzyme [Solirubrobacterales bacterium]|nr:SUMF1/EgtB/PvdO family nonheme iron enzyme [Solirubrobacterales bacterium]
MRASTGSKGAIAERLAEARRRTLELIEPLDDEQLNRVYSEILSPLAWDLGHIANFEELWLVQTVGGRQALRGELGRFYDAIENPRSIRNELPILRGDDLRLYLAEVRERTLDVLAEVEIEDAENPLLREGFVYEMLIAHEQQHNETMLQLLMMVDGYEPKPVDADPTPTAEPLASGPESVTVKAGAYAIGASPTGFAYDNERPRHPVELPAFEIDRHPVTNGEYARFLAETGAEPPLYWQPDGDGGWTRTAMGRREPLDPAAPVVHVSWHEADAFARWAGKRLPTEQEWEAAVTSTSGEGPTLGGLGQVWEWTASDFVAYPGFEPFPYAEYSQVFFGSEYKVLRGGSRATCRNVMRPSFRNWDLPQRRQIFAGLRCARDA